MSRQKCVACKKIQNLECFHKRADSKSGHRNTCKSCQKIRNKIKTEKRSGTWYKNWECMVQRCENPNNKHYSYYGGRGIKIHPSIRKSKDFYAYMGERPIGMSIDRIDPNGDYAPGNIRWATPKEQVSNRRNIKKDPIL